MVIYYKKEQENYLYKMNLEKDKKYKHSCNQIVCTFTEKRFEEQKMEAIKFFHEQYCINMEKVKVLEEIILKIKND